jgi:hypothetical protein
MKTLNQLICEYNSHLQQGEIQTAYKGIMEFIGKLRADVTKKFPRYDIGSLYQGYMDTTYFSLSTKVLKNKGLKLAIVYEHTKGTFEIWLSARNRDIAKQYESALYSSISNNMAVFHDNNNLDAIIEFTLTPTPNFEEQDSLMEIIEQSVEKFEIAINNILLCHIPI